MMKKYSALTKYINLLKNDNAGEWTCDKENDGSSERPIHVPFVSYSIAVNNLADDIYKFAKEHELSMLRVSDLYKTEEEHGIFKEFRTTRQALLRKLRTISSESNRVLVAELAMGLDHITLREDLTPFTVLKAMTI